MTHHETAGWNTADEKHLADLMDNASRLITPGDGYSLKLDAYGVTPTRVTFEELQAHYSVNLDPESGSDLHITLDQESGLLAMQTLSAPLSGHRGRIHFDRATDDKSFMPYITVGDNGEVRLPYAAMNSRWQHEVAENLLQEHGIDTEPPLDHARYYRMWLGHQILSKCAAWNLMEKRELRHKVIDGSETTVSVLREQDVPKYTMMGVETISVLSQKQTREGANMVTANELISLKSYQDTLSLNRSSFRVTTTPDQQSLIEHRDYHTASTADIAQFTGLVEELLEKS